MRKYFRDLGEGWFFNDPNLKCQVYEWSPPEPKRFGKLRIRFLCPLEDGPRRLFVGPLIQEWFGSGLAQQYLDRACACGQKILRLIDEMEQGQKKSFSLFRTVFRNRRAGKTGLDREFGTIKELVDRDPLLDKPELLLPGVRNNPNIPWQECRRSQAVGLLSSALTAEESGTKMSPPTSVADVICWYEALLNLKTTNSASNGAERPLVVSLDQLPGRSSLDLLFTDGVYRRTGVDFVQIMTKVRTALISGPTMQADFDNAVADEQRRHFIAKIINAAKKRPPRDFDRWLAQEREHGFRRLIAPGHRASAGDGDDLRQRGTAIFCSLLWQSYLEMGRCYGALMLLVWLHFCFQFDPDPTESLLFRQMHCPQVFLAGLPLAFLGRGQLRWIAHGLLANWRQQDFQPVSYDYLTDMLSVYGTLCRERRDADRRAKAHGNSYGARSNQEGEVELVHESGELRDVDDPTKVPELQSPYCPTCGTHMELLQSSWLTDGCCVIETNCRRCQKNSCYHVTRQRLQELARR